MQHNRKKTPLRIAFGENIRKIRKERGWSQYDFSKLAGLHHTYVSSIERGERNVSLDNICILAKALGCTTTDLFKDLESIHVKDFPKPTPVDRLENLEMQLEILVETIKELRRDKNNTHD